MYRHPFYYLSVRDDRNCYDEESFMNFKHACDGGGERLCRTGATQDKKVVTDLKKSKKLD